MNQRGSGSILGICVLFVLLWIGMILFDLSKVEHEISAGFLEGMIAQNLAESGAHYAIEKLKWDKEFTGVENSVMIEGINDIPLGKGASRQATYRVYVTGSFKDRVILSIGETDRSKRQIIVRVKLLEQENSLSVVQWNNE